MADQPIDIDPVTGRPRAITQRHAAISSLVQPQTAPTQMPPDVTPTAMPAVGGVNMSDLSGFSGAAQTNANTQAEVGHQLAAGHVAPSARYIGMGGYELKPGEAEGDRAMDWIHQHGAGQSEFGPQSSVGNYKIGDSGHDPLIAGRNAIGAPQVGGPWGSGSVVPQVGHTPGQVAASAGHTGAGGGFGGLVAPPEALGAMANNAEAGAGVHGVSPAAPPPSGWIGNFGQPQVPNDIMARLGAMFGAKPQAPGTTMLPR